MNSTNITVRSVGNADRAEWNKLYAAYANYYESAQTPEMRDTVFSWLLDEDHESSGLVAVDTAGQLIGFAHYRPFARPLAASTGVYLDDLFVDPGFRGSGAARQLLDTVAGIASANGWSVVRWITRDNNYRARNLYDKVATHTNWVTYDMPPAP
ncbi:GNAT family N-acetyltransferase [Arthrobacter pigmenti]